MEFSEIFGFLTIIKESIILLSTNWKFTAPIITVSLFIPSILLVSFVRFWQVVRVLSVVVCVAEESYQGKEAMDKARQLVEGQRVHGFMINLLVNVMLVIVCLVCWICLGIPRSTNLMIYGLVFVNFISLARIPVVAAYTVYYFWCKRHHGEEIESIGDLPYTKLPTAVVGSDVL